MKNTHLSLEDRRKIQEGLENELSRTEIAKNINKDISTVAKEIKNRRKLKPRNPFNNPLLVLNLKSVRFVTENALNMKKLNVREETEKLVYVIFAQIFLNAN